MLTANAVNRDELFVHVLQLLIGQLKYPSAIYSVSIMRLNYGWIL